MTGESNHSEAEKALKVLFRRLGRIAIEAGVTAPVAYRLMKEALVEAAEQDFPLEEKRLTDSRISVLTGVHRKDVRAIRSESAPEEGAEPRRLSLLATVIGRWLGDPALQDEAGAPIPLPRHAPEGASFDALVADVTSDVRARTLLDELRRKGAVEVDEEADTVTLTERAIIGTGSGDDGFFFLARNVGDHIAAVAENMIRDPGETPFLERAVFYNGLTEDAADEIEALCRARGAALIEDVNRAALKEQKTGEGDERFRFGVYFYRETEPRDPGEGEKP